MILGSSPRARSTRRRQHVATGITYLLFCGGILAIALLMGKDISPPVLQAAKPQAAEIPVATIQFTPDINNMCRRLLFHNDTGRYQEGGTAYCQNLTAKQFLRWTVTERTTAIAKAFRSGF